MLTLGLQIIFYLCTVSEKVAREEFQVQEVVEKCVGSPHITLRHSPTDPSTTTRVCVITSVVVDTPSIVVCSVDVEPCKTVVSCSKPIPVSDYPSLLYYITLTKFKSTDNIVV